MGNHHSSDEEGEGDEILKLKEEKFIAACRGNQINKIKTALSHVAVEKRKKLVDKFKGSYNMMGTHICCEQGHAELLSFLVFDCKADLMIESSRGNVPLHIAARSNHAKCCEVLLKATSDWDRARLLWIAFFKPNDDCILSKLPRDLIRMLHSYSARHNEVFRKMVLKQNNDGLSPLEYAMKNNAKSCFPILISPLTIQSIGVMGSPLIYAASKGCIEVLELMLRTKEVSINETNHRRETPLYRACCAFPEAEDVVKFLLDNGADYSVKSTFHRTALEEAEARKYHKSVAHIRNAMRKNNEEADTEKRDDDKRRLYIKTM